MKAFALIILLVLISEFARSQSEVRQHFYTQVQGYYGKPIIYSDSLTSKSLSQPFMAGSYRFGVQTNGERHQDQYFGFPKYGLGLFHVNLNHKDTLGNPWAFYMFYNAPIFRQGKFQLNWDGGVGLAWNFAKFDSITNPQNDLVGSSFTAYFSFALNAEYRISPRISVNAGVNFIHFSNGTLQTPNKGMNLYAANLGLSYYFQMKPQSSFKPAELKKVPSTKIVKSNELDLTMAIGGKATRSEYGMGPKYFTASSTLDFYHRYHWVGKYGAGLDWFYDTSLKEDYTEMVSSSKYMFVGAHLGHELMISKFTFVTHLGTYFYKGTQAKGAFFFRLGIKYYIIPELYTSISLKTVNGFKADYIEWGMGYRFKFKSRKNGIFL